MASKRVKQSIMLDRISHMPKNVIDIILSYLPLCAAVRTSTLSKTWRIQWTRAENLVLDQNFFDYIFRGLQEYVFYRHLYDDIGPEDEILESKYVRIVGNILLSHSGPIRKFILYVPIFCHSRDAVNSWILAVSQNGVQDLTLHFERLCCKVPSYVFQCMELKHLSLIHLDRSSLPHNFGELSSLLSLDLHFDEISGDLLTHIFLNCSLLERLSLRSQTMDGSCAVNASELKVLCLACYTYPNFILINTPNLSTVSLEMRMSPGVGDPYMLDFFGAVPKIEKLTLTGSVLQDWGYYLKDVPKMLPTPLENHSSLIVYRFNMGFLEQVRSLCCLINSSPLLQTLDITIYPIIYMDCSSDYLKSQIRGAENLWSLRTVRVSQLMGNEPEINFIELILARSRVLEKLYLSSHSQIISSDAEIKMMTDIMRFRRASTQAEIIYSSSSRSSSFPVSVSSCHVSV